MKPGSLAPTRVVIRKRVAAPRERVFRAWTDAEQLRHWFFPGSATASVSQVEVDLRVGGRYCIMQYAPDGALEARVVGTYHEVQPPVKLVFSWVWAAPDPAPPETLVTVEFHEVEGMTEIVVTHECWPALTGQEGPTIGWHCCLARLVQLVEVTGQQDVPVAHTASCR
jgi:uncharacterized protein YndB with AHSA1/START domain